MIEKDKVSELDHQSLDLLVGAIALQNWLEALTAYADQLAEDIRAAAERFDRTDTGEN